MYTYIYIYIYIYCRIYTCIYKFISKCIYKSCLRVIATNNSNIYTTILPTTSGAWPKASSPQCNPYQWCIYWCMYLYIYRIYNMF